MYNRLRNKIKQWQRNQCINSFKPYWFDSRNKYQGKPCWVIGNGPSLSMGDLERLQGQISIASNRIHLAFSETKWRPTFVTCIDDLVVDKHKSELLEKYDRIHVPSYMFRKFGKHEKIVYWRCLGNASREISSEALFSNDATNGLYGGHTVTFENLQLAAHLGCNPIYILGCDHYYQAEKNVKADQPVPSLAQNHFHPAYRQEGELVNPAPIEEMNKAYGEARKWGDQNGVQILNATRGGHLDIFLRVDFDAVVGDKVLGR